MFTFTFMLAAFVIGYTVIALEHPLKINKTATALLLGVLLWVCAVIGGEGILVDSSSFHNFVMNHPGNSFIDWLVHSELLHSLGDIAEILFFLMGAMTIVEIIDTNGGFTIITDHIKTKDKRRLLWIIGVLTFFMSAVLDNLTTSIVMIALLRKMLRREDRLIFSSIVILAANAGGAWSPIGDVTTIMLWIAGDVSTGNIIVATFLASITSLIVPLVILSFMLKGEGTAPEIERHHVEGIYANSRKMSLLFFCVGVGALICVPVFKTLTHLPPYLGMLGGLGILWVTSEIVHRHQEEQNKTKYSILSILSRIDISSILFFLGILLAVNALRVVGHLTLLAQGLDGISLPEPSKYYVINIIIGVLSSIVDNVPLVAGAMGMYHFPTDHYFWEMLAYCAGTGGSILIIGSAAGVAVMGLEKIDFIWYLKKVSWIALIGYFCGAGVFIAQKTVMNHFSTKQSVQNEQLVPMTQQGIEDFLYNNTFYMQDSANNMEDLMNINFVSCQNNGQQLLGFHIEDVVKDTKTGNILSMQTQNALEPGSMEISLEDTSALLRYGSFFFQVTQHGQLYQCDLSEYGVTKTEWKRK